MVAAPSPPAPLHVRCGDDIREALEASGIEGKFLVWADPLCEGPLRRWASDNDRWRDRAIHLSTRYFLSYGELLRNLGYQDTHLADAFAAPETVLWFEHDLFDQAILVFLLRRLAGRIAEGKVSLVSVDRHPSVERFIGLGQLGAKALAELHEQRVRVTPAQATVAGEVWDAMTSPDPTALARIAARDWTDLPFLGPALRRYLAEFPSTRDGLGLTERLALEAIAGGAGTPRAAFPRVQAREAAPFQGDTMFFAALRGLARGRYPLIRRASGEGPPLDKLRDPLFAETPLEPTPAGETILAGRDDWFRLYGASGWIGGVHLIGPDPAWRFDERAGTLVRAG